MNKSSDSNMKYVQFNRFSCLLLLYDFVRLLLMSSFCSLHINSQCRIYVCMCSRDFRRCMYTIIFDFARESVNKIKCVFWHCFSHDPHTFSNCNHRLCRAHNSYWQLKKEMAAGSEPPHIARLLARMRPLCEGLSLCGAGAGGFAIAVLKSDRNQLDLESCVRTYERELGGDSSARSANDGEESQLRLESEEALLTVHSLRVDTEGIAVREVEVTACSDISGLLLSSTSCLRSL